MYDKTLLINLYPQITKDPKVAEQWCAEAEKCLKTLLPVSPKTASLFRAHFKFFASKDDYDDLVQSCLAAIWENAVKGEIKNINRIDGFISSVARNQLLCQIYQCNRPMNKTDDLEDLPNSYEQSFISDDVIEAANTFHLYERPERGKAPEIFQFSRDYVFIASHKDTIQASLATGVDASAIWRCLIHERKTAGGFIWLYCTDKLCELMNYEN